MYSAGLIGIVIASYLAANGAFAIYSQLPDATQRSWWTVYALNYVAPFCAGVVIAPLMATILTRRGQFSERFVGHLRRAVSWYLFAASVLYIIYRNRDNGDFGLWSQIIIWPFAGTIGALLMDLVLTWRRSWMSRVRPNGQL